MELPLIVCCSIDWALWCFVITQAGAEAGLPVLGHVTEQGGAARLDPVLGGVGEVGLLGSLTAVGRLHWQLSPGTDPPRRPWPGSRSRSCWPSSWPGSSPPAGRRPGGGRRRGRWAGRLAGLGKCESLLVH